MIIPPFLKPGDKIGIVAPARKVTKNELDFAVQTIRNWDFEPVFSPNLFESENQFSGSDEQRANDIDHFLQDRSIRALISARGGYGCLRIIDQINWDHMIKDPKWLIGYSDLTAFESLLYNKGIASIHGTMAFSFSKNEEATEGIRSIITGKQHIINGPQNEYNRNGVAEARLTGGNLSLLYAMQGSSSFPETKGTILFIEDLDEYLYHIDRMMINLKRSGVLKDLAGLVVGGMSDMKDNAIPFGKTAEQIIREAVNEYNYPVCFDIPAGHIDRNLPLVIGAKAELSVSAKGSQLAFSYE
jgi:muramoyltetrapeptide carboxypeptidase